MRLSYILKLACKNLSSHKLRSFLTVLGVSISVGFIIVLMSFTFGIEKIATNQIADGESLRNLDVTRGSSKIAKLDTNAINKIKAFSDVSNAFPQTSLAGDIQLDDIKVGAVIYAVNNELLGIIKPQMVAGRYFGQTDNSSVVINTTLANRLADKNMKSLINSTLDLRIVLRPELFSKVDTKTTIITKKVIISGITDDGKSPYMFIPISIITELGADQFSDLKVIVKDVESVDHVKSQIDFMGFKTSAVKNTIDQVVQFFGLLRIIFAALGMISGIVALLGIFNTMTISLMEKTREVGLMKILGLKNTYIRKLFLAESALIGLIGSVLGISFGLLVGYMINEVVKTIAINGGNQAVQVMYLPIWFILLTLFISVAVSIITGFYPSGRATRINPLDALRYE